MTKDQTAKVLSMLRAVWSNEEISPEKIEVYHWVIGDYSFEHVIAAVRLHIGRGKFFPKPAELVEIIAELTVPKLDTGEAWRVVTRQIGLHGYAGFDHCEFGDEAISDAIRSVGWRRICLDDDSKGYVRRDFEQALTAAQERRRREVQDGAAATALPAGGEIVQLPRRAS